MNETVFTLDRTGKFITESPDDAFRVLSGAVYV